MTEATLVRWRKTEAEAVSQGEILFEFESDKSLMEFESPADGVLAQILVAEGETVPCGTPVVILKPLSQQKEAVEQRGKEAEKQSPNLQATPLDSSTLQPSSPPIFQPPNLPTSQLSAIATPAAKRRARELGLELAGLPGRGPNGRVHLADVEAVHLQQSPETLTTATTPMARRLAQDLAVDLGQVKGSGPGGRVVKDDILQAARQAPAAGPPYDSQPLSSIRQLIGQRMSASAFTAPHVTLFSEADATALVDARRQLNAELNDTAKISYNTLLIALVARALRQHPELNAGIVEQEIRHYHQVNIALAVDTERGLLVPVIQQADTLSLLEIQATGEALIQWALAGKSRPDDFSNGTFTITNLGMFEIDAFTPIINPPQAAILGVGRIVAKPVIVDGQVAARQMMTLSLSFDHRLIDGGPAARFLQRVKQLVERPFALAISASRD